MNNVECSLRAPAHSSERTGLPAQHLRLGQHPSPRRRHPRPSHGWPGVLLRPELGYRPRGRPDRAARAGLGGHGRSGHGYASGGRHGSQRDAGRYEDVCGQRAGRWLRLHQLRNDRSGYHLQDPEPRCDDRSDGVRHQPRGSGCRVVQCGHHGYRDEEPVDGHGGCRDGHGSHGGGRAECGRRSRVVDCAVLLVPDLGHRDCAVRHHGSRWQGADVWRDDCGPDPGQRGSDGSHRGYQHLRLRGGGTSARRS